MKIGIDARSLIGHRSGVGQYLFEILTKISKIDKNNEYYLYSHQPIDFKPNSSRWKKRIGKGKLAKIGTLWLQTMGRAMVHSDDLDIFWGPAHILPFNLSSKTKKIVTIHDLVWLFYPQTMNYFNLIIHRMLANYSLRQSDRIICVSQTTANDLTSNCKVNKSSVEVVYEGVDPEKYFQLDQNDPLISQTKRLHKIEGKYLLFLGSIEPRKNLVRVLKALKKLKGSKFEPKLVIVGATGWKTGQFEKTLSELGLDGDVILTGHLPEAEKVRLIQGAQMLIFPSLYEGFGLPLIEAMACGIPVITSNTSSMAEIGADCSLLVDPLNIDEISGAMIKLTTDHALRSGLVQKGLDRARQFSWELAARNFLKVCEDLARK